MVSAAAGGEVRAAGAEVRELATELAALTTRPWTLMEACGGQTHAIVRWGLDQLLPPGLRLLHGPGCPVCVTPAATIDAALELARRPGVILASYGDMLRVPGSVPGDDLLARQARELGVANLSILAAHVRVPPAMEAILTSSDPKAVPQDCVQGFLAAGHVAAVMGTAELDALANCHQVPVVVTGFEPADLLRGVLACVRRLEAGRPGLENAYGRVVRTHGNPAAQALLAEVFTVVDRPWRGLGLIPGGGLDLAPEFADLDARRRFGLDGHGGDEEPGPCIAGRVLQGRATPDQCPAFGRECTPEQPLGAPMVSSEGACAAWFRYRPAGVGGR